LEPRDRIARLGGIGTIVQRAYYSPAAAKVMTLPHGSPQQAALSLSL